MPLKYGGVAPKVIKYNGAVVKKIIYGGKVVWSSTVEIQWSGSLDTTVPNGVSHLVCIKTEGQEFVKNVPVTSGQRIIVVFDHTTAYSTVVIASSNFVESFRDLAGTLVFQ